VCVPGIKKENLKLNISEGVLTLSYKTEESKEEKDKSYFKKEFSSSSFERKMTLPKNCLENEIKASFNDGILNIVIPKDETKKPETTSIPID
ncbi:Hsp20/alpha crystallin family protein, partial [Cetobacterium sp.]|uniref:Hsp20/alpha crystallin family protein n=1 Tax=Cetobacterium sp. TaxID=2071632 RepID=UPI003AF0A081